MGTLGEVLTAARDRIGLSQGAFADRLGVHRVTVIGRERGRADVPGEGLLRVAEETGLTIAATPHGWEVFEPPSPVKQLPDDAESAAAPVLGDGSAGVGLLNDDLAEREWFSLDQWLQDVDGVVRVQGESMEPLLRHGDLVGVRETETPQPGDIVVAQLLSGGEVLVKLYTGMESGLLVLQSINPEHGAVVAAPESMIVRGVAWGLWRDGRLRIRQRR